MISRRRHRGPLLVQSPFYPEGDVCHTYILHPPGGVAGGDALTLEFDAAAAARVLLTTPAAGKFYRCRDNPSHQRVSIRAGDGACVEWLPQENILFDGARTRLDLDVHLAPNARLLAWDMLCLGRPLAGEAFAGGGLDTRLAVYRGEMPEFIETLDVEAAGRFARAPWGLAGRAVLGTFIASPAGAAMHDAALAAHRRRGLEGSSVTRLRELVVCRYLGDSCAQLREYFMLLWQTLRPLLSGLAPCPPRVWTS